MEIPNEIIKKILLYRIFSPHPVANLVKSNVKRYKQSLPWDSFLDDEEEPFYKWHCNQFYLDNFCVGGKWKKCICKKR